MATVTTSVHDIEVTLTLTQNEALYVYSALHKVDPTDAAGFEKGDDPVYEALGDALRAAGISTYDSFDTFARVAR